MLVLNRMLSFEILHRLKDPFAFLPQNKKKRILHVFVITSLILLPFILAEVSNLRHVVPDCLAAVPYIDRGKA